MQEKLLAVVGVAAACLMGAFMLYVALGADSALFRWLF